MTFIASVIAKKGVALIADSLVTSVKPVIDYDKFIQFIQEKSKTTPLNEVKIDPVEMVDLFDKKPSHTKDFEEKLFKYDDYTAVMTAGSASINKKKIESIINEIVLANKKIKGQNNKRFETKIKEYCSFINIKAKEHINAFDKISHTTFIFCHYNKTKELTEVYKVDIIPCSKKDITGESFSCVEFKKMDEYYKVVCDGQNRISERILFGEIDFFLDITPKIIKKVLEDFKVTEPKDYIKGFMKEARDLLPKQFFDDMKVNKLADLSLQQAVDLAYLLMKVEINFQKYTENVPTVGGVIKLAVIDKDGFRFILGNDIIKPENLH